MVTQPKTANLEKKHRKFLEFLRSRPEGFNFSKFVRKRLEEKMEEMDWEYEEEDEDREKPDIFKDEVEKF